MIYFERRGSYQDTTGNFGQQWPDPWCECSGYVGRLSGDYVVPCPFCGRRKAGGIYAHLDGTGAYYAQTTVVTASEPEPFVIDPAPPHWVTRAAHRAAHVSPPPMLARTIPRRAVERWHRSSVRRFMRTE